MDVYQRRRLVALSALAGIFIIIVLLIRSCGGDEETPEPLTTAAGTSGAQGVLTQEDYAAQADAICLEANTALAGVDESDFAQAAGERSEIVTGELQQLQTLAPPDDGENKLDKFLGALEDLASTYADQATAAERGDDAAAAELDATIEELNAVAAKAADKFGMKACGDPSKVGDSDAASDDEPSVETTEPADSGDAAVPTTTPVTPTTTTPVEPVEPVEPAPTEDVGGAAAPTDDTGGTGGSSGGVSP